MADAYSGAYSFMAIMFTHTPELIDRFSNSSVKVITNFEVTRIGVPTITGMYYSAYQAFNARYYGYVNADILLNYTVFDALKYLLSQVKEQKIHPQHELAGRVYEEDYSRIPYVFESLEHVQQFFRSEDLSKLKARHAGSAVSVL